MTQTPEIDVLVVGAGAAGLTAALSAARAGRNVVVLNKGQTGRSGATATITGDISVDSRTIRERFGLMGDASDSPEQFLRETLEGGAGLNDPEIARAMCEEVPDDVAELLDAGLKVSGLGHAPGHSVPRGVLVSGMQLLQIQTRRAIAAGVTFRDEFQAHTVLKDGDRAAGIAGIDLRTGRTRHLTARAVILATGCGAMVHPFRTVPEELTGDGYRMALEAGAALTDMEMIQFLPCCLANPPLWRGIQFPWIIGPQSGTRAWLLNRYGERFMARYDPDRMEQSTRDIVSRACVQEVQEGRGGPAGGVFMSWAHLPREILDFLPHWYGKPLLRTNWVWEGFDFAPLVEKIQQGHAVEVVPAAHFMMGGIHVDAQGATAVPGLFACGEVAGGAHGANRLSGNACSQFLVTGRRAGVAGAGWAGQVDMPSPELGGETAQASALQPGEAHAAMTRVQSIANDALNVLRDGPALDRARGEIAAEVAALPPLPAAGCAYDRTALDTLELRSAALTVQAMVLSAADRQESRGAHTRLDHPAQDDANHKVNIRASLQDGALRIRRVPVAGPATPCRAARSRSTEKVTS